MNEKPNLEKMTEPEHTLRLVAQLPAPEELTDRVHARLAGQRFTAERRGFWSLWMPVQRLQFAGAAVLMVAVAGSTWAVYHSHVRPNGSSAQTVHPQEPQQAGSSFGTAGAVRVPPTLAPIKVPPSPKKKSAAGRKLAKPLPGKLASRPSATVEPAKSANTP